MHCSTNISLKRAKQKWRKLGVLANIDYRNVFLLKGLGRKMS